MDIPDVEEVLHMSSYPLIESMGFDTDIYDGVAKMRGATLLGEIFRLHKCTINPLKYVHINSKYGYLVSIPDYDNQELFSRSARYKVSVRNVFLNLSGGK